MRIKLPLVTSLGLLMLTACQTPKKATEADKKMLAEMQESFEPLPASVIDVKKEADKIALGKKLYFEKALSANGTISCNSCHQLDKFGVDNETTSPGHNGKRGDRNSPTVYNSALYFAQFWDGRAKDLAEQAIGPLLNPIEHGLKSEKEALSKIDRPEYRDMFKKAGLKMTYKNIGVAIAAFEKTLLTPSRYDDYLAGNVFALNDQEKKGMKRFNEIGCISCHDGPALGGGQYQKLGVVNPYKTEDKGRFAITKDEDDMHVFKVPTLRNVTRTGPYFHDGSIKTLDEVIRLMAWHQLGEKVSTEDISDIKAFLTSLEAKELPKI